MNAHMKARKYGTAGTAKFPARNARLTAAGVAPKRKNPLFPKKKRSTVQRRQQQDPTTPKSNFITMRRGGTAPCATSGLDDSLMIDAPKTPTRVTNGRPVATISRLSRLATPKRLKEATATTPNARTRAPTGSISKEQILKKSRCLTPSKSSKRNKEKLKGRTFSHTPSKVFDHLGRRSSRVPLSPVQKNQQDTSPRAQAPVKKISLLKAPTTKIPQKFRAGIEVRVSSRYEQRRQERLRQRAARLE
uniref:Uncharacterized protein n=1 Tax=Percolomonas cosmopolitus TaxID=63605 RepID=A0A7S1PFW3_9EUKA|mmetsp:Transcript_4535/g.17164  ORF Transcript_4535/g.17164 Transcript_4535/m.17164 type:complete len:247 (+) Transcript_4535:470-1210(+)